jgi:hypothetical protein
MGDMDDRAGRDARVDLANDSSVTELSFGDIQTLLKDNMDATLSRLESKLDDIKTRISGKLISQISKDLNKQIKESVEKAVSEKVGMLKNEVMKEIDQLRGSLVQPDPSKIDRRLNFVIYNCEQSENENVERKVNAIIREGLKLNISIKDCKRIQPKHNQTNQPSNQTRPQTGIIIASCNNPEEKERIMKSKPLLRESRNHSKIRISHDYSPESRRMNQNLKMIISEIGKDKFDLIGGKLIN